jgi:methylmalonyl-CoA mutase
MSTPERLVTGKAPTRHDWVRAAEATLRGKAIGTLASVTEDGIRVEPVSARVAAPASIPGMAQRPPLVMPLVAEDDSAGANAAILSELGGGGDGVVIQVGSSTQAGLPGGAAALAAALDGVHLDATEVALRPGDDALAAAEALLGRAGAGPKPLGLALGADPVGAATAAGTDPDADALARLAALGRRCLRVGPVTLFAAGGRAAHEAGATEAQELAAMLASGVAALRALEAAGLDPEDGSRLIALDLAVDADIFLGIAKLRAGRRLWASVLAACGATAGAAKLHATTSARMMSAEDVHTNMLRTTAAALAASVGGADAVTVLPFTHALGKPDGLARRTARNAAIILAEESWLGAVSDPALGSGHIEALTGGLCEAAWSLFQETERDGLAALREAIGAARAKRQSAIADGSRVLVGVNAFRNADDRPPRVEARDR